MFTLLTVVARLVNDPPHFRNLQEPCAFCGARWVPVIAGRSLDEVPAEMEHTADCAYLTLGAELNGQS